MFHSFQQLPSSTKESVKNFSGIYWQQQSQLYFVTLRNKMQWCQWLVHKFSIWWWCVRLKQNIVWINIIDWGYRMFLCFYLVCEVCASISVTYKTSGTQGVVAALIKDKTMKLSRFSPKESETMMCKETIHVGHSQSANTLVLDLV